jgi:hypothetical protein
MNYYSKYKKYKLKYKSIQGGSFDKTIQGGSPTKKSVIVFIDCGSGGPKITPYDSNLKEIKDLTNLAKQEGWRENKLSKDIKKAIENISNKQATEDALTIYKSKITELVDIVYSKISEKGYQIENILSAMTGELRSKCIEFGLSTKQIIEVTGGTLTLNIISGDLEGKYQQYSACELHRKNNEMVLKMTSKFSNINLDINNTIILVMGGASTQLYSCYENGFVDSFRFGKNSNLTTLVEKEVNRLSDFLNQDKLKDKTLLVTGGAVGMLLSNLSSDDRIDHLIQAVPVDIEIEAPQTLFLLQEALYAFTSFQNSYLFNTHGLGSKDLKFEDVPPKTQWKDKWADAYLSLSGKAPPKY